MTLEELPPVIDSTGIGVEDPSAKAGAAMSMAAPAISMILRIVVPCKKQPLIRVPSTRQALADCFYPIWKPSFMEKIRMWQHILRGNLRKSLIKNAPEGAFSV